MTANTLVLYGTVDGDGMRTRAGIGDEIGNGDGDWGQGTGDRGQGT